MDKEKYKELVSKYTPSEPRLKNIVYAFLSGGFIAFIAEFSTVMLTDVTALSKTDASLWVSILIILVASISTAVGFFDNLVSKCKCGLIIPTTGFAHSVSSASIDYKKDGLITGLGANFFKLAGSVILYGIVSSFFLVVLKVIING